MSFYNNSFARIKVTGLTDGTGVWNTVNIATLAANAGVTIPVGTKSVHLKYDSVSALGTTYGARKVGSSDTFTNAANARVKNDKWVELTSNQVELHIGSNTSGEWYIEGFDSHFTFLTTPIEKGGSTVGGTYTITYSELPAEAAGGSVIMELSRNIRIGHYANVPLVSYNPLPRAHVILPLDSSKRLQYITSGGTTLDSDLRVVAWAPAGAVLHATTYGSSSLASTGTWLPLSTISTQTVLGMWRFYNASDNVFWGMRASDNTTDTDVDTNLLHRYAYTKNGPDGVTKANVSNTSILFYYFGGVVASLAPANISGIDQLIVGSVSRVTLDNPAFSVTTISISDGAVTKTVSATLVSAGVYDFTVPSWVDETTGLLYGSVNVTASDGTESTPVFPMTLSPASGYATQIADSISIYNYGAGWVPPLKIGTQSLYNSSQVYVFEDMTLESVGGFTGSTNIWDRDPDDYITRSSSVTIGSESASGGLTSSGLTSSGLTRAGLTSVGL